MGVSMRERLRCRSIYKDPVRKSSSLRIRARAAEALRIAKEEHAKAFGIVDTAIRNQARSVQHWMQQNPRKYGAFSID